MRLMGQMLGMSVCMLIIANFIGRVQLTSEHAGQLIRTSRVTLGIGESIRPPSVRGLPARRNCVLEAAPNRGQWNLSSVSGIQDSAFRAVRADRVIE